MPRGAVLLFVLLLFPPWWAWGPIVTSKLFGRRHPAVAVLIVVAMPAGWPAPLQRAPESWRRLRLTNAPFRI